ncbi:hypothetical protein ABHQ57_14285 [Tenacibaculum sp. ZH5_bin.1]|uniref:hypothetical protein n=1 Tax=Tenacibaculum TaxID=104267 RepID=UPI0014310B75|nr:hypothetical protein [Tenacibaculum mesophilum]KAF9658731.1 hypothetical protein HBA12_00345 [Tenacibaculum mesophilum]
MATLTVKPSNTLKIKTQRVKKAYLAKKEIKGTEKTGETESYTFKGSNNTSTKARKEKIATIIYKNIKGGLQKKQQQTTVAHIVEVLKKDSYTKGDCIDIPLILPKIEFTKLANANLGDEVYMVVETENMANKRIKLSLKQAEKDCLVEKDSSIVLQQDGKKTSVVETYVSRFAEQNKKNISNAEDYRNFAIDAVTLSPKEEKDQKKYREALNKTTDKKTKLFMVVDAEPVGASWKEVFYDEVFDLTPNQWYYGEKNWFELQVSENANIYEIHLGKNKYEKIKSLPENKKFIYKIYNSGKLLKTHELEANEHNLLDFPKEGDNWGRYGSRDKGGDNWINEEAAAGFFGFLYTLKNKGIKEKVYYNDISANDKRNIGHKTHRTGHDIDIRYPGADNSPGGKLWAVSKKYYKTEEKFVEALEEILSISIDWGFMKKYNYAYKKDIKHTKGKAISVHQDHYHIGFKR